MITVTYVRMSTW